MKQRMFKSGVNFGEGLTKFMQEYEFDNEYTFLDSPGLSDPILRKQAAQEIKKILEKEGIMALVFICELVSGRVRNEDITTIKLVLEALDTPVRYGILFNKIPPNTLRRLEMDKEERQKVMTTINLEHFPTDLFFFNEFDATLMDEDNALPKYNEKLVEWLKNIPPSSHDRNKVKEIPTHQFENHVKSLEQKVLDLNQQNSVFQETIKQQNQQFEELKNCPPQTIIVHSGGGGYCNIF